MFGSANSFTLARQGQLKIKDASKPVIVRTLLANVILIGAIFFAISGGGAGVFTPLVWVIGAAVLIQSFRNWEFGIKAILVTLVVEGAVRKWFAPSLNELIYFYKDILMIVLLPDYFKKRGQYPFVIREEIKLYYTICAIFFVYALIDGFNPRSPHYIIGIFGVKAYCLYMPMAALIPRVFSSTEKIVEFLKWYLLIALAVAFLGILQFFTQDPHAAINRYAEMAETTRVDGFFGSTGEQYVRVTGTFSYITGMSVYLSVVSGLLLGLVSISSFRAPAGFTRWLYYLTLGGVIVASFMTGSRGAAVSVIGAALIFYSLAMSKKFLRLLSQAAMLAILSYVALVILFPQAYDALYTRTFSEGIGLDEARTRISQTMLGIPVEGAAQAGLLGYGTGTTQSSVSGVMRKFELPFLGEPMEITAEGEPSRVMLDLGIVGYILYVLMKIVLFLIVSRLCFNIRHRERKILALSAFGVLLLQFMMGGAVATHTQNVYQWFLIGFVFALANIDKLQAGSTSPGIRKPPTAQPMILRG